MTDVFAHLLKGSFTTIAIFGCAIFAHADGTPVEKSQVRHDVARWTEDVELHDGRIIQLDRRATQQSSGFPLGHRGLAVSWELCYMPSKIYWKSGGRFIPFQFEMIRDIAYVKVPLRDCSMCKISGFPKDSFLYFVFRDGGWQRVDASEFPGVRWRNLMITDIFDPRDPSKDVRGHISLAEKRSQGPYVSETPAGQRRARALCAEECSGGIDTDLTLDIESKPTDAFCR
jgi:hypothetical protein